MNQKIINKIDKKIRLYRELILILILYYKCKISGWLKMQKIIEIIKSKYSDLKFKIISKKCKYKMNNIFFRKYYDGKYYCSKLSENGNIYLCDDYNCLFTPNKFL